MSMPGPKKFFKSPDQTVPFPDYAPTWHRLAEAEQHKRTDGSYVYKVLRVVALCGYERTVLSALTGDHIGYTRFDWRDDVKTKALRCARCDKRAGE